jgi:hypothetical protein
MSSNIRVVYIYGQADELYILLRMGPGHGMQKWCKFSDGLINFIYVSGWAHVKQYRCDIYPRQG